MYVSDFFSVFKKVPVEITNLGDTTHTEYRSEASHTVDSTHGAFSRIVQSHEYVVLNLPPLGLYSCPLLSFNGSLSWYLIIVCFFSSPVTK
jgi:hypothetical protein